MCILRCVFKSQTREKALQTLEMSYDNSHMSFSFTICATFIGFLSSGYLEMCI